VQEVHVTGRALGAQVSSVLNRNSTLRVRAAVRKSRKQPELKSFRGRVGELDKDRYTFYLRRENGTNVCHCSFTEELLAEVENAFIEETDVIIAGKVVGKDVQLVSIALPEAQEPEVRDLGAK
jgi:hypothetical protein